MRSPVGPGAIVIVDDPGAVAGAPSAAARALRRAYIPLSFSHPAIRIKQILRLFTVNNNLKLIGYVTPLTLNQHAWVYVSCINIIDRAAEVSFDSSLATYIFCHISECQLWHCIYERIPGGVSQVISIVITSKDEASLDNTLTAVTPQVEALGESAEIVVVDASDHRLDYIRLRHEMKVRWVQFDQPPGVTVTIPHQRNVGVHEARGTVIVFIDAACQPQSDWLTRLVAPLRQGEHIAAGLVPSPQRGSGQKWIDRLIQEEARGSYYIRECGAANLAFRREVFDAVGGFDEGFTYGSDTDFSWRAVDSGYRIRWVPDAVVRHDWGTWRRELRRHYVYGKARARLYRKHRTRVKNILRYDSIVVAYPIFLLGLPLTLIFPFYPALLLIPVWRNHSDGALGVLNLVAFNLTFGAGVLVELFIP